MNKNILDINNNYNYNSNLINNNYINNISNEQKITNNSVINNEINFEYINVINNAKEIKNPPLISITYKEFNSTLLPFEYLNDIWESFIDKEKFNDYSFKDIISTQTDIKETMRCILIDWIISLQNQVFMKKNTLFLTINLIDRYLSKKSIHRTKFQLLGVTSLFIACKYEEIYSKNINQFVELTARAFDKNEILEMEKTIIDLVDFNLDLPLSDDFFDLLSTVFKFNKKEYNFGCFLLEAFLLDITCCEYKQSQIALATCFIVLGSRQVNRINPIEGNNFVKYYCEEYKVNFDIWKDYDIIVNCAKKIYYFYENSENIIYKEVYKIFNNIFI
jgi:cyclin B